METLLFSRSDPSQSRELDYCKPKDGCHQSGDRDIDVRWKRTGVWPREVMLYVARVNLCIPAILTKE